MTLKSNGEPGDEDADPGGHDGDVGEERDLLAEDAPDRAGPAGPERVGHRVDGARRPGVREMSAPVPTSVSQSDHDTSWSVGRALLAQVVPRTV